MKIVKVLMLVGLFVGSNVYGAQQTLNNGATMLEQRTKINNNFTELYGWGDHAAAGYLLSYTETDPVFTAWDKDYSDLINKPTIPVALSELTDDSTHRVVADTEKTTWNGKQDTLISGTNIKTINSVPVLGSGDIVISGAGTTTALSVGTVGTTTVGITTENAADDVILPAATNAAAGVVTAAQVTAIEANSAKVSSSVVQTVDPTGTGSPTDVSSEVAVGDALALKQNITAMEYVDIDDTTIEKASGSGTEAAPWVLGVIAGVFQAHDTDLDNWATIAPNTKQDALTIISGSKALLTTSLAANTCRTETDAATGAAATDVISGNFNLGADGVAGYGAASADGMKIYAYPTTNTVNFDVCNGSDAAITPGARTLNWQIIK